MDFEAGTIALEWDVLPQDSIGTDVQGWWWANVCDRAVREAGGAVGAGCWRAMGFLRRLRSEGGMDRFGDGESGVARSGCGGGEAALEG